MATKAGIFMIADSLDIEDIRGGVTPAGKIEKLYRVKNLNVALSFWGTTKNHVKGFDLTEELKKFDATLKDEDNVVTVSNKIKDYFEKLDFLEDDDNLGFHICGYIGEEAHIHHVHHIISFPNNHFKNEDSKQEFEGQPRYIEYPILFTGDNRIPNLVVNLIGHFNDRIIYEDFDRQQAKDFLTFLMDTAFKLQRFSSTSLLLGALIDYPLIYCEITKENIYIEQIPKKRDLLMS